MDFNVVLTDFSVEPVWNLVQVKLPQSGGNFLSLKKRQFFCFVCCGHQTNMHSVRY